MEIISIKNLNKSFGERVILDNLNLTIQEGEMIAIMGGSGSGKTTLLNILGLLDAPTAGTYTLLGIENPKPFSKGGLKILRDHIGFLFQNYGLLDDKTVAYNLSLVGKNKDMESALARVGLSGFKDKPVHQLSGGEQQRVALARLLLKESDLILADEPTGSLDEENRSSVMEILSKLNEEGKTIVIVTHDMYVAEQCDRIINL